MTPTPGNVVRLPGSHMDAEPPSKYPADGWVRSIEFVDYAPNLVTDPPVHVTGHVYINGEHADVRSMVTQGWSIIDTGERPAGPDTIGDHGETIKHNTISGAVVSFLVHPDDCSFEKHGEDGEILSAARIGGLRCLTPTDPEFRWTTEHFVHPTTVLSKDRSSTENTWAWVRVYIQVREAAARAGAST